MRAYELMIIFDGDVEDTAVNAMLANVNKLVEAGGGEVKKTDRWGRRRFAYEINHKWEGIYVVLDISTEGRDLSEVERVLHLADDVRVLARDPLTNRGVDAAFVENRTVQRAPPCQRGLPAP